MSGSQTTVDCASAPASRGVKYSGASEPAHGAHGFSTACSFFYCVLNRPSVIYWYRIRGECKTSLSLLWFVSFVFSLCSFLWNKLFYVVFLSQISISVTTVLSMASSMMLLSLKSIAIFIWMRSWLCYSSFIFSYLVNEYHRLIPK